MAAMAFAPIEFAAEVLLLEALVVVTGLVVDETAVVAIWVLG